MHPPSAPRSTARALQSASLPRTVLAAAALVLAVLGGAAVLALVDARLQLVLRLLNEADRSAEKLALRVDEVLDQVDHTLLLVHSLRGSGYLTLGGLRHAGLGASDVTRGLMLTDRRGAVIDRTSDAMPHHIGDDEQFRAQLRRGDLGTTIGAPVLVGPDDATVIPVMRRLVDERGDFDGTVVAWLDPAAWTRDFDRQGPTGAGVAVIGADGIVRTRVTGVRTGPGTRVDPRQLQSDAERVRRTLEPVAPPFGGAKRFVATATVERYPLLTMASFRADAVMTEFAAERLRILGWAGTAALLVVIGAGLLWGQARQLLESRHAARHGQALYQATLEGGLDAVWLLQADRNADGEVDDFRVTEANGRALAMLGHTRAALLGRRVSEVLPTVGAAGLLGALITVMRTQRTRELERLGSAGEVVGRWLHVQIVPVIDGAAVVVRDIDERKQAERRLAESESFLRALLDALPVAVYSKSSRPQTLGQVLFWNRAAELQFGRCAEDIIGRSSHDYLHPALAEQAIAQDAEVVRDGRAMRFSDLHYDAAGQTRYLNFVKAPVRGADGDIDHVIVIAEDTTEKHAAAAQLELISRLVQETGDAIVLTDAADRVVLANAAFASLSGWQAASAIGRAAGEVGIPALDDAAMPGIERALATHKRWSGESHQIAADGRRFETWLSVTAIHADDGELSHHARSFSDISGYKTQERRLVEMARLDGLTGLANRRHFEEQLVLAVARAQRSGQPLALLFLDLDGFKSINDTLGHEAGDQVLIGVADRLRAGVRATDLVSRLGGDEFTVILEGAGSDEQLQRQCERLLDDLSQTHLLGVHRRRVTPSMGLAVYRSGESIEALRHRADTVMYQAKRAGKGRLRTDRCTHSTFIPHITLN